MKRLALLEYNDALVLYKKIISIPQIKDLENFTQFFGYFDKTWFSIGNKKIKKNKRM